MQRSDRVNGELESHKVPLESDEAILPWEGSLHPGHTGNKVKPPTPQLFVTCSLAPRRLVGAVDASYFQPVESVQAALRQWEDTWADQVASVLLNRW